MKFSIKLHFSLITLIWSNSTTLSVWKPALPWNRLTTADRKLACEMLRQWCCCGQMLPDVNSVLNLSTTVLFDRFYLFACLFWSLSFDLSWIENKVWLSVFSLHGNCPSVKQRHPAAVLTTRTIIKTTQLPVQTLDCSDFGGGHPTCFLHWDILKNERTLQWKCEAALLTEGNCACALCRCTRGKKKHITQTFFGMISDFSSVLSHLQPPLLLCVNAKTFSHIWL